MFSFLFHLGDYYVHTKHLSESEDLAYRRLIDIYYLHERPPKGTPEQVARMIGVTSVDSVRIVLEDFFQNRDGAWHNKRCDEEIQRYKSISDSARRRASKRWHKPEDAGPMRTQCISNAVAMPEQSISNANLNLNHKPKEKPFAPADLHQPRQNISKPQVTWTENGFNVPDLIQAGWRSAYPAVKLDAELAKAHAWVLAHPKNRKSQWGRFLNSWLQKSQDRAPVMQSNDWRDDPKFRGLV